MAYACNWEAKVQALKELDFQPISMYLEPCTTVWCPHDATTGNWDTKAGVAAWSFPVDFSGHLIKMFQNMQYYLGDFW